MASSECKLLLVVLQVPHGNDGSRIRMLHITANTSGNGWSCNAPGEQKMCVDLCCALLVHASRVRLGTHTNQQQSHCQTEIDQMSLLNDIRKFLSLPQRIIRPWQYKILLYCPLRKKIVASFWWIPHHINSLDKFDPLWSCTVAITQGWLFRSHTRGNHHRTFNTINELHRTNYTLIWSSKSSILFRKQTWFPQSRLFWVGLGWANHPYSNPWSAHNSPAYERSFELSWSADCDFGQGDWMDRPVWGQKSRRRALSSTDALLHRTCKQHNPKQQPFQKLHTDWACNDRIIIP